MPSFLQSSLQVKQPPYFTSSYAMFSWHSKNVYSCLKILQCLKAGESTQTEALEILREKCFFISHLLDFWQLFIFSELCKIVFNVCTLIPLSNIFPRELVAVQLHSVFQQWSWKVSSDVYYITFDLPAFANYLSFFLINLKNFLVLFSTLLCHTLQYFQMFKAF